MEKTKTLLFGGSFDPIHDGHVLMAKTAAKALDANQVVFILARHPRWKTTSATPVDRAKMLEGVIISDLNFQISDIELKSEDEINYTYVTVGRYLALHPNEEVAFLIGSDQANQFDQWYAAEALAKICQIVVYERPDDELNLDLVKQYNMKVVHGPKTSASSTNIRRLRDCQTPLTVLSYIARENLYYMPELHKYLSPKRLAHSLRVARLAYEIAKANNVNYGRVYAAALLHDIGKEMNEEEALAIMKEHFPTELANLHGNNELYHQFVGAYLAKTRFKINDEEILDAIAYHSSGKEEMNLIGKILYSADKIEPGRKFDSSELIKACMTNWEDGFIEVLKANQEFLEEIGVKTENKYSQACFTYYLGKEER